MIPKENSSAYVTGDFTVRVAPKTKGPIRRSIYAAVSVCSLFCLLLLFLVFLGGPALIVAALVAN